MWEGGGLQIFRALLSVLGTVEQGTSLVEGGPDREYCQREDLRVRVTTSYTRYSCVTTATPVTLDTRSPVWLEAEPGTHINMLHLCLAAAAWTSELANDAASSPPHSPPLSCPWRLLSSECRSGRHIARYPPLHI